MFIHEHHIADANSSSSHSVIFLSKRAQLEDDLEDTRYFCREQFLLVSKELKSLYLFNSILGHHQGEARDLLASRAMCYLPYLREHDMRESLNLDSNPIDHQSLRDDSYGLGYIDLPDEDNDVSKELWDMYHKFLIENDRIGILGGSDEAENTWLPGRADTVHFILADFIQRSNKHKKVIIKKHNNTVVLFDPVDSYRVVLSQYPSFQGLENPLLVDLKITDNCPFGCSFCYQGSTSQGKHADFDKLKEVVDDLAYNGVLSVAIGGGEPTLYPRFSELLSYLSAKGIQANFTTKNLAILNSQESLSKYMSPNCLGKAHSIAFSASSYNEVVTIVNKIKALFGDDTYRYDRFQIQVVNEVLNPNEFKPIFEHLVEHNIALTILGFKPTNFGASYKKEKPITLEHIQDCLSLFPPPKSYWDSSTPNLRSFKLSVDTCYAKTLDLNALSQVKTNVPIHTEDVLIEEGQLSCYIDCVEGFISKSSYETQHRVPLSLGIHEGFAQVRTSLPLA